VFIGLNMVLIFCAFVDTQCRPADAATPGHVTDQLWSTAPFLLNNSVGENAFEQDPSVGARMRVFQASIEQMLWPEKRQRDPLLGDRNTGDPIYLIDRTTERSNISMPAAYVPESAASRLGEDEPAVPVAVPSRWRHHHRPFPKGLPVNLLATCSRWPKPAIRSNACALRAHAAAAGRSQAVSHHTADNASDQQMVNGIADRMGESLVALDKCPDFEVNPWALLRHRPGFPRAALSDSDKRAPADRVLKTF